MSQTDAGNAPQPSKQDLELQKLTEEVAKLRGDRGWYYRHLAVLGALCGVGATFLLGIGQYQSNTYRNEFEIRRGEIESRLKLLEFTLNQRDKVLSGDPDAQIRYFRVLKASLPEREAKLVLDAFAGAASRAEVLAELQSLGADIPIRTLASAPTPALTPPQEPVSATGPVTTAAAPPVPATPTTTTPATATLAPSSPAPSTTVPPGTRLALYAHIARDTDRAAANLATAAAGDEFPLAGIEYVPSWGARPRAQGDVRFYKSAQKPIAAALAARLGQETGLAFNLVDLSRSYPNLPGNRIEVWFPQFPDR